MPPYVRSPVPQQNRIRLWRKHRKLTLQQLADAIGSTKGHLSNVENGVTGLRRETAEAIASELGITTDMLINRPPGEEVDLEQQLLSLFREANDAQRRAMIDMAKTIRSLNSDGT